MDIMKFPSDVLKKKAERVEQADIDSIQHIIDDMIETMYAANGIGLAAPQVGISKRLIVIDVLKERGGSAIVLINPEVLTTDGIIDSEEGCLSIPQYSTVIKRAEHIVVKGLNRHGEPVEIEGTGLLARALQHEIDHLDGILIIDRISQIKREFFKKRYLKAHAADKLRR